MADAICHLGEIVVSESDPTTSLWPGLFFFSSQGNADCRGQSNRNWGFVAGGWASTQLSPRTGDAGGVCQWLGTSPGQWTDERLLSAPLPWHRGRCHQHHWALPLPWPHSSTASVLFPSWEAQQETHRGLEVKCGISSFLPTRVQNTFLQGCTHDWTVPPICLWTLGPPGQ